MKKIILLLVCVSLFVFSTSISHAESKAELVKQEILATAKITKIPHGEKFIIRVDNIVKKYENDSEKLEYIIDGIGEYIEIKKLSSEVVAVLEYLIIKAKIAYPAALEMEKNAEDEEEEMEQEEDMIEEDNSSSEEVNDYSTQSATFSSNMRTLASAIEVIKAEGDTNLENMIASESKTYTHTHEILGKILVGSIDYDTIKLRASTYIHPWGKEYLVAYVNIDGEDYYQVLGYFKTPEDKWEVATYGNYFSFNSGYPDSLFKHPTTGEYLYNGDMIDL